MKGFCIIALAFWPLTVGAMGAGMWKADHLKQVDDSQVFKTAFLVSWLIQIGLIYGAAR